MPDECQPQGAHNLSKPGRILSLRDTKGGASSVYTERYTVPGKINKFVPPPPQRPNVSGAAPQPPAPARSSYVPRFGRPAILMPDDFWSNLRQFLTERSEEPSCRERVETKKGAVTW